MLIYLSFFFFCDLSVLSDVNTKIIPCHDIRAALIHLEATYLFTVPTNKTQTVKIHVRFGLHNITV